MNTCLSQLHIPHLPIKKSRDKLKYSSNARNQLPDSSTNVFDIFVCYHTAASNFFVQLKNTMKLEYLSLAVMS
jgi:hypothetical protein